MSNFQSSKEKRASSSDYESDIGFSCSSLRMGCKQCIGAVD